MSRVGKMPITVPQGVDVSITADQITVKGANGTLTFARPTRWSRSARKAPSCLSLRRTTAWKPTP